MKRIGLVTDRDNKHLSDSDRLLLEPLAKLGVNAEALDWEDKKIKWQEYDLLILRSCWNYHFKYYAWLDWLDQIESKKIKLWNPIEMVRWNSQKSYLLDLKAKGVTVVPTRIVKAGELIKGNDLVIKPLIGASAYGVKRLKSGSEIAKEDCLVQPFVNEVENGEISLVYINKTFSHAIIKIPKKNDFRSNYSFGAKETLIKVPSRVKIWGEMILNLIPSPLLYARVDAVIKNQEFMLMELELIEPHLFLDLYPTAALTLAKAIYEG